MKQHSFLFFILVALVISCTKDNLEEHFTFFKPVYVTKESVKANIRSSEPELLENPGKLVVKDKYLYLNDADKGIHIIDISNPSQIKNVVFIHIPGCIDLAVKGDYLYADCYTDMVTIDISNPLQVTVKQFLTGVFPHRAYRNFVADTTRVIQQWIRVDTVLKRRFRETLDFQINKDSQFMYASASSFASASGAGIGKAGSMARFALLSERLYTVSDRDLKVFNVARAEQPFYVKSVYLLNGNIETIFPYADKLFIGSQNGMFIYHTANPDEPVKLGQFMHARSCDPVITDGRYAYVTLRAGNACGGNSNQLDVIDVKQITNPQLVKTYPMNSPAGLAKDGNLLLICDGKAGVKIMEASDAAAVTTLGKITGMEAYDVIAENGYAIVVAKEGIYSISYSDPLNPQVLAKIPVTPTR
ncbi:MAG: hypothetical protein HYU71_05690 [Bacteroidetes bacterium]|nr:hypothetical protein [Bacteroidota bacterium]